MGVRLDVVGRACGGMVGVDNDDDDGDDDQEFVSLYSSSMHTWLMAQAAELSQ